MSSERDYVALYLKDGHMFGGAGVFDHIDFTWVDEGLTRGTARFAPFAVPEGHTLDMYEVCYVKCVPMHPDTTIGLTDILNLAARAGVPEGSSGCGRGSSSGSGSGSGDPAPPRRTQFEQTCTNVFELDD